VPHITIGLTEVLAVVGSLVGTAGFVLGILNHLRDRPRIVVSLLWDMSVTGGRGYDPHKKYALVKVTNTGRRPVYISHASLKLPKGYAHTDLLLSESLQGNKLDEGDPPKTYVSNQDDMAQYAKDWKKIRAIVRDSAGKEYSSGRPHRNAKLPTWARISSSTEAG
jgi:hypothetical protein